MVVERNYLRDPRNRERPLSALMTDVTQGLLWELGQGKSRELERYLGVMANFPFYSLWNHHLLYAQRPDARAVATVDGWNRAGWWIRKGEHASAHILSGEQMKAVFDEKQVWQARREAVLMPRVVGAREDPMSMNTLMRTVLFQYGIYHQDVAPQQAWLGERRFGTDMSEHHRFMAYAIALASQCLVLQEAGEAAMETRAIRHLAEAVGFVVGRHFGVDVPLLREGLGKWGKTIDNLQDELELVRRVSGQIITELRTPEYAYGLDAFEQVHYAMARDPQSS